MVMIQELYPDNAVMQKKVLQMINRKALFFHEWENRGISVLVKMLMDEMRQKKIILMIVSEVFDRIFTELLRMCEKAMPRRMK